ncbi:MAG: glycerophosphodiester phosphodiesterase [Sedimentisphaerales bacterium]|nr:glycerophosphodiester phosphodiesterase [Sedimentisphaerales bacterium]
MKKILITMLLGVMVSGCGTSNNVEIIAHRGASYLAPENTRASALLAWEKGTDGVEIDVYLSADNRIVVRHDKSTKRTSGVDLMVAQATSQELRKLEVGSWKDPKYAGEKIPFLEEIIETIPPKKKLFIEIKCGPEIVPLLKKTIVESGKIERIVIISFNLEAVAQAKQAMPQVPAYWLLSTKKDKETKQYLPHDPKNLQIAQDRGLDGLDVHNAGVTPEFMQAVKECGQKLYVWTVDDPIEAQRLVDLGVAGITTNRPGWLREQLKSAQK